MATITRRGDMQWQAKMLGWKSIQMAMRYYHPRAEDLARKLG